VQWYHNKVELKESKRVSIQHQSDMHMYCSIIKITDIKKEDAGTYEVTARNREGEATNTLVLNVTPKAEVKQPAKAAPIVVKPLTATVCKVGESVKLETVITGTPKPGLEWSHNGKAVAFSDNVKVVEKDNIYTLSIDNVTTAHDGEYTVKAANASGSAQTSAYLSVQGRV
jgi:Immunoglobulin I-set domain